MRRLFTVLFILIASAAYAEDVFTEKKIFFIPFDLPEYDVRHYMLQQQEEFKKQRLSNKPIEYGAAMNLISPQSVQPIPNDNKEHDYWFSGICYINNILYGNMNLVYKDSKLKKINFTPFLPGQAEFLGIEVSEDDEFDRHNTEFITLLSEEMSTLIRCSTFIDSFNRPCAQFLYTKLGFFSGGRSYLIRYKVSTETKHSMISIDFFDSLDELDEIE